MAEQRRLEVLYNRKMAEVHHQGEVVDRVRAEMIRYPEREAVLMPIWVASAREWQRLWAETRAVASELVALLRRDMSEIDRDIKYWEKREH